MNSATSMIGLAMLIRIWASASTGVMVGRGFCMRSLERFQAVGTDLSPPQLPVRAGSRISRCP
jgi:hypothetical protein